MPSDQPGGSISRGRLRLWPGVVIATALVLSRFVTPLFVPDFTGFGVIGSILCGLAAAIWWTLFSRAPRSERWGAPALMVVGVIATWPLLDVSIATGAMGGLFLLLVIPTAGFALVAWAVAARHLAAGPRRATMAMSLLLACAVWTLVRTDGMTSARPAQLRWRWTPTAEDRLLAQGHEDPVAPALAAPAAAPSLPEALDVAPSPAVPPANESTVPRSNESVEARAGEQAGVEWSGFRGARRDGTVRGLRIETDWAASPPHEIWRRPIGPGWSSFAVRGDVFYTQEQRGDDEIVAAYRVSTGEPVWRHRDAVRFWESNGGAGPRATPTLSGDRVYTFGATGILNVLDAGTGALVWARHVATDTSTAVPMWGFASSPLVIDDLVVVAAAGTLASYDVATGTQRWIGPRRGDGYSSPHLAIIDGVAQVLLLSASGAVSVAPADGSLLWEHTWPLGAAIVQPALTADGDVLITGMGMTSGAGTRRLSMAHGPDGWTVTERWTSNGLKPYFNDFVVHEGHAFGFDGSILACIDLEDGSRRWKAGRYGQGQLVLLTDQDLLLVSSEEGELALVEAASGQFTELARIPGVEGKTWNHPVVIDDILLVRNGEEMAAFRLARAR